MLAAFAILPLSACAAPKKVTLQPCDIQLHDKPKVVNRTLTGVTLQFPFTVQNAANECTVQVDYLDINASINGSPLGHTKCRPSILVEPGKEKKMPIKYEVSIISAGPGIIDALAKADAQFTVEGTARLTCAQGGYDADPLEYPITLK